MNSELTKDGENVGFRFPALVSLPPKRRCKSASPDKEEQEESVRSGAKQGRLKKSGRVIFRWPAPAVSVISPVVTANGGPYAP
jgi:hypothetical protein